MKNMKLVLRGVEKVVKLGTHSDRSRTRNGTRLRRRRNLFVCDRRLLGFLMCFNHQPSCLDSLLPCSPSPPFAPLPLLAY